MHRGRTEAPPRLVGARQPHLSLGTCEVYESGHTAFFAPTSYVLWPTPSFPFFLLGPYLQIELLEVLGEGCMVRVPDARPVQVTFRTGQENTGG